MRYDLKKAAQLAEASYGGKSNPLISPNHRDSLDHNDVQAHFLNNGTLLIPGSNSLADYTKFNLRLIRLGKRRLRLLTETGADGVTVRWHQGFLAHAKEVQDWIRTKNYDVTYIIGHSLGAASAQILSRGWNVPAIAFAAPRPCSTKAAQALSPLCLCVNRKDDRVCKLPRHFHHSGQVRQYKPAAKNRGGDHSMPNYIEALDVGIPAGTFPERWPE